jgi:hypothetical protein
MIKRLHQNPVGNLALAVVVMAALLVPLIAILPKLD